MAHQAYISIKGTKQGQFKGESTNPQRRIKWIEILGFEFGVSDAYDSSSGQISGRRQHSPITVTKEWGAASPQIFAACATNEVLSEVGIEVADHSQPGGHEKVAPTINLTNAVIVARRPHVGPAARGGRNLTDLDFVFQMIRRTAIGSSKASKDSWVG